MLTVSPFVTYGCLNPQFSELLRKTVTPSIQHIKLPHKTFWTQFNLIRDSDLSKALSCNWEQTSVVNPARHKAPLHGLLKMMWLKQ